MVFDHDYEKFPELTNSQLETLQFTSPHIQITDDFFATVVKVHDGDTVTLRTNFRDFDFPLRLTDIDAPELNEGGDEARDYLSSKVLDKSVIIGINFDNRVGKYGRLLGSIIRNGANMAQEMLRLGLVVPFGLKKEGEPLPLSKIFSLKAYGIS